MYPRSAVRSGLNRLRLVAEEHVARVEYTGAQKSVSSEVTAPQHRPAIAERDRANSGPRFQKSNSCAGPSS